MMCFPDSLMTFIKLLNPEIHATQASNDNFPDNSTKQSQAAGKKLNLIKTLTIPHNQKAIATGFPFKINSLHSMSKKLMKAERNQQ